VSARPAFAPSLRRRLLLVLLIPLVCLAMLLGAGGAWFIHQVVEHANDRVLSGSTQAIAETLALEDGELTVDLPPAALGMLENADRDNVFYSVWHDRQLVTGYAELPPGAPSPVEDASGVSFRYGVVRGDPVRIAQVARQVPRLATPVYVQVAETLRTREAQQQNMLAALGGVEVALVAWVALLVWLALSWGLDPLAELKREVEARVGAAAADFRPLPVSKAPREVAPFVSAFNVLLAQLEGSVETTRRFTADASHQMRTPLAVLRAHLDSLTRHSSESLEGRAALADIEGAVRTLGRLLTQLIALARAEDQGQDVRGGVAFDLVETVAEVARERAPDALKAGLELAFERPDAAVPLNGEPILVHEMVANLLDNAIRYNRPGGAVTIRVVQGAEGARLEVEDDGPGIPQPERERVFERFYRMTRDARRDGSGLGLPIVRALAQRLGAEVRLDVGRNGSGLKATIQFPVTAEAQPVEA